MSGQKLRDQGHTRAKLAGQPDAGQQSAQRVRRQGVYEAVGKRGHRVEEDRPEQNRTPPSPISKHAPQHTAHQHAHQLSVQEIDASSQQCLFWHADALQALHAHDVVENEIVGIDEIAQRRRQHGQTHALSLAMHR